LGLNRSSLYYKNREKLKQKEIKTEITYLKIKGGMAYLAAIIDWHSKAVLSHKISNSMDSALVMDVLEQALLCYGTPEIFNTDQGEPIPQ